MRDRRVATTQEPPPEARGRHTIGRVARLVLTAVGIMLLLAAAATAGTTSGVAIPSSNLVRNPGAEESPGTAADLVVAIAGWTTTGSLTAWTYGALGDRPDKTYAASIGGGQAFFSGGPGGVAGVPTASQQIDVSAAAVEIDAGTVAATLAALIGGYTVSEDLARVDALFYDAAGTRLGSVGIGPVNRDDRNRMTVLLPRTATADVPKLTRRIDVVISVKVDFNGKNHAYVDNISLTLAKVATTPPAPPPTTPPAPPSATGKATLVAICSGKTLVAMVRPAKGPVVSSVTFLVNTRTVGVDKKAPFTARIRTAGLPAQLKVGARVKVGGKTIVLTKAVKRC